MHSNWTSYDNIQIHVNKKNSRFTAKVVTKKKFHREVDVAFARMIYEFNNKDCGTEFGSIFKL